MTRLEQQLPELLDRAAPASTGIDFAEVSRRGRRVRRRRRVAMAASAVLVAVGVSSLVAVIATSGHPQNATIRPAPFTGSDVTATLTPAMPAATAAGLRADAAVLNRRLDQAGIRGRVETGAGSVTLHLPASAAGSVAYLAGTGHLSFRVPSAVEPVPATPTTATGGCVTAAESAGGGPPPCISAQLSAGCPKAGTPDALHVAQAPALDWVVACDTTGTVVYALAPQQLGGDVVDSAEAAIQSGVTGTSTGQWIVTVKFTPAGQSEWANVTDTISKSPGCPRGTSPDTTAPVTCQLAIELDGVVQSAPVIQERIAGPAEITGTFTEPSARALAAALGSGTLPVPLHVGHS